MRYNPNIYVGLTDEQVKIRQEEKLVNYDTDIKTISIKKIIYKNVFTLFNLLNFAIALCIFLVHSYKNLLFMGIVFCNTVISIIQEVHAKKTIDKLNVIATKKILVLREGEEILISIKNSETINKLWQTYSNKYKYANNIKIGDILDLLLKLIKKIDIKTVTI